MRRLVALLIAVGAVPLAIVAYRIQIDQLGSSSARSLAIVAAGLSFLLAGLIAWLRRPENRLGPLLAAAGLLLLLRQLRYSDDPLLFTVFFALGELGYALVAHAVLAYPAGRVTDRAERVLMKVGYATLIVLPVATLLFHDGSRRLLGFDEAARESLLLLVGNGEVADALQKALRVSFYGVLSALFIAAIVRRFVGASPRTRRIFAPLLLAAVAIALRAIFQSVSTFFDPPFSDEYLFWWQIGAFIALPVALVAGLVRARMARAAVGDLVLELQRTPPEGLRDALARALDDPTLELAFWLPERGGFVDPAGQPIELPPASESRAVTELEHEGRPVAALVHDPSLLEEPRLVRSAGAAARMAIENARLQAELRAQLDEVRASRKRIVAAGDAERRRLERNLHDGAQQQLVAVALKLRAAQGKLGDPAVDRLLSEAVNELQGAVDELRELARGVHPAILTEEGLGAALESLASRSAFPVRLVEAPEERFPADVEGTAYFLACEALANVVKHAQASRATIDARRMDGVLVVEVEDDGVGGARPAAGSGLRGLADRVEALGGHLRIESPAGGGTRIVGEIPCGS
ncbi:MAG: sensor histidine kinase [Thermoleophilia bacterium]|nr:sensor histidine kinase [Thermoleophilia bacterium]